MLVFTLAGPSLVYVRRPRRNWILIMNFNWSGGANWDSVRKLSMGFQLKIVYDLGKAAWHLSWKAFSAKSCI